MYTAQLMYNSITGHFTNELLYKDLCTQIMIIPYVTSTDQEKNIFSCR